MRAGAFRFLAPAMLLGAALLAGCDRVLRALELTGTVAGDAPQLVGPERLRVVLPETGAVAVLGPVARNGDVTVWQTLDGITLSFRQGVLIATRGLGDDLMSADVAGDLAHLRGRGGGGYYPHIRSYLDGENQTVFRAYQCRGTGTAPARVEIGGQEIPAQRTDISCVSPERAFTNIFWQDGAGRVIRSRQWISPNMQYMDTERVAR